MTESRHYDDYAILPLLLDLEAGAELRGAIVGFACGVNAAQWRHFWDGPFRLRVDGAELDPGVLALGREFFGMPAGAAAADGRPWLAALPEGTRYHLLVVDAFANELYIPYHLGTREFFELCLRRLEPGGVLAMNVYAVGEDAPNLASLENTLATVFGGCLRLSQYRGRGFVLVARRGEGPPDLAGLVPARARERFGAREGVAEWDRLLELAAAAAGDAVVVAPRPGLAVLTDDHAPLEWMTDRFLGLREAGVAGGREDVAALARKQDRTLAAVGAGWAAVLGALLFSMGRVTPPPGRLPE